MADRVFWLNSALYIVDICFHSSQPMRDHASLIRLWVQGDNACKEVRNSFTGRWMTLLCQAGYFTTASHMHMEVGHTHEDIGCGCEITCTCVCVCVFLNEYSVVALVSSTCGVFSLLDGVFSICTSSLNQEQNLQTPADVRRTDDAVVLFSQVQRPANHMQDIAGTHGPSIFQIRIEIRS